MRVAEVKEEHSCRLATEVRRLFQKRRQCLPWFACPARIEVNRRLFHEPKNSHRCVQYLEKKEEAGDSGSGWSATMGYNFRTMHETNRT